MRKIKLCTLCSGYDSQMMAMKRLAYIYNFDAELVAWSEIDEIPIKAHKALFPESADKNLGDMTKINWNEVEDFDILTYSTPCTNISIQGRQEGLTKGSGTASSIIWEVEKCIATKKPKYLLLENVKQLVSKKYINDFNTWLNILSSYGYTNYWKVLDSADFDVPQHRERVFVVSILNGKENEFTFPEPIEPMTSAKDLLEPIDTKWIYNPKYLTNFHRYDLSNKEFKEFGLRVVGNCFKSDFNSGNVYDFTIKKTIAPTCMMHHGTSIILERLDDNGKPIICKMTPREMFKFMGVSIDDINIMENVCGSGGLLKMAGNSIVVEVLYHIFKQMLIK